MRTAAPQSSRIVSSTATPAALQSLGRLVDVVHLEVQVNRPRRELADPFMRVVESEAGPAERGFLPVVVALERDAEQVAVEGRRARHVADVEVDDIDVPDERRGCRGHRAEHTFSVMGDLFADAARERLPEVAPLAMRLRPRTLDEFVGQQHVLGPHSALRLAIEADRVGSMILYGPPGTGKTTLARIVAETTGAEFEELSAVSASVGDVRGVMTRARDRLGGTGGRTILFLDEIHRFNKAQQDALLPAVEEGLITLIGSTTENPYFEVNAALLSRCQVYELEPLSDDDLAEIVRRGAAELGTELEDELVGRIAERAGGDARTALNILELSAQTAEAEGTAITEQQVEDASRKRPLVYDRAGDAHYDFISAFIKSMRGSDPDASVYYLAAMLESGEDARFIARRMIVLASEDIGNADPRALLVAVAAAQAVEHVGLPGGAPEPRAGGHLPRARPEVERELQGARRRDSRRPRGREPQAAEGAAERRASTGEEAAREGAGLHLPARRPRRLRGRLPAGRAQRHDLLHAERLGRRRRGLVRAPGGCAWPPSRRTVSQAAS